MKKLAFLGVLILLAGVVPAMAQVSASDQLTVNAVNQGIFLFDIAATLPQTGVQRYADRLGVKIERCG